MLPNQEVRRQDEKAQVIIQNFRAEFAGGKSPSAASTEATGKQLRAMWEERNAIALRARDKLRLTFGEEAFSHFDKHVKETHFEDGPTKKNSREQQR